MKQLILASALVLLFAGPIWSVSGAVVIDMTKSTPNMELVFEKMEKFVNENLESSGLTYGEMLAAYGDYSILSKGQKEKLSLNRLKKLAIDFVINPVGSAHLQLHNTAELRQKYVRRAEKAYRRFRVAYLGGKLKPDQYALHPKTKELGRILFMGDTTTPLTKKLIKAARLERSIWAQKLDDIVRGSDVFSTEEQREMTEIWNFLNHSAYRIMYEDVLPEIKTDEDIDREKLVKRYDYYLKAKHSTLEQKLEQPAIVETKKWWQF